MYEDAELKGIDIDLDDSDRDGRYYNIGFRLVSQSARTRYTIWLMYDIVDKELYNYRYFADDSEVASFILPDNSYVKLIKDDNEMEYSHEFPHIKALRRLMAEDPTIKLEIEKVIADAML